MNEKNTRLTIPVFTLTSPGKDTLIERHSTVFVSHCLSFTIWTTGAKLPLLQAALGAIFHSIQYIRPANQSHTHCFANEMQ